MRSEAAKGAVMSPGYALGLLCECCGARRSDGSRRWCAECRDSKAPGVMNSVEAPGHRNSIPWILVAPTLPEQLRQPREVHRHAPRPRPE